MYKPLKRSFFNGPADIVAPKLLGKGIVVKRGRKKPKLGIIVETEAYGGNDPAAHSFKGKTPRTEVMFGLCGFSYVYFIYGMYHCLNFVTNKKDVPGAVLIRALEISNEDLNVANGPGKLCRFLEIDKSFNAIDSCDDKSKIFVTADTPYKNKRLNITQTIRIGISKAVDYPWRWYITDNKSVSKK